METTFQQEFNELVSELKNLKDAEKLECSISNELPDFVILSGEILGKDTLEKISTIAQNRGIRIMINGLTIMYREPKPASRE